MSIVYVWNFAKLITYYTISIRYGEMAERSIASDCKSDASRLHRFKSGSPQCGPLAHLARAPALHAGGDEFDSRRVQIFVSLLFESP